MGQTWKASNTSVFLLLQEKQTLTPFATEVLLRDCEVEMRLTPERFALPWDFGDTVPVLYNQPLGAKQEHRRVYPGSGNKPTAAGKR